MKKCVVLLLSALFASLASAVVSSSDVVVVTDKPDKTQQKLIDRAYGMFIHFGMNTFIQAEWSEGKVPASTYNPTQLDPEQWVRVAKEAGFRYVVLTTKHHDGFCIWDSKYTDYDVASSLETMDVVGAVADACRKYGLKFGIYYSLWDRHEPSYASSDFENYIVFMENQLRELLTNYGEICELWLDGGWDKPAEMWQIPRLYKLVKELQPYCAFAVNNGVMRVDRRDEGGFDDMAVPDDMVRDNSLYLRYHPVDFRLADPRIANWYDSKQYLYKGKSYHLPFEHTICISNQWTWFQKNEPGEVRSDDELEQLFYWCTSNDNALVVNLPPDTRGLIRDNEANAVISLAKRLGITQKKPLPRQPESIALGAKAEASSVWQNHSDYTADKVADGGMTTRWASEVLTPELTIELDEAESFNKVVIFEYMDDKRGDDYFTSVRTNRIQRYALDVLKNGEWETVYVSNQPMGDCKVVRFPRHYNAEKLRLRVLEATNFPSINEILVIDGK